jgi:hypothetical protein
MEQIMSSPSTTHFPMGTLPRGDGASASSEQPVVLIAFAKLVILVGALAILTPAWLDLLGELADAQSSRAWGTLRVVALFGAAAWIAMGAMAVKVWVGLIKFLARAD